MGERIYLGDILGNDSNYYRGVFEYDKQRMLKETTNANAVVKMIDLDEKHFIFADSSFLIYKMSKENLRVVGELKVSNTISIKNICYDGTYLYVALNSSAEGLLVIDTDSMSLVANGPAAGTNAMTYDDKFLYAATSNAISKINKTTLEVIATIRPTDQGVTSLLVDGDFLYAGFGGQSTGRMRKISIDTMSVVEISSGLSITGFLGTDEEYIYAWYTTVLRKIPKTNINTSINKGIPGGVFFDNGDFYLTSSSTVSSVTSTYFYKYDFDLDSTLLTSEVYTGTFDSMIVDKDYIYILAATNKFLKYSKKYRKLTNFVQVGE